MINRLRALWKTLRAAMRVLAVGLAAHSVLIIVEESSAKVVWFMSPSDWCQGSGYIQAHFGGLKRKNWNPVPGSFGATAYTEDGEVDPLFEFVNDVTPNSSKPRLARMQSFGVWRWYIQTAEKVLMRMEHENPVVMDNGKKKRVVSIYGPYRVPDNIPECLE